ncbi:DNA polymerase V [Pustulibacterium marinum]|uniref:DNA polymerase V n=1 Tax=Pustulibacterium marinum TaxID=1224947 RepID=A0A1I7GX64_9FLAO|nr:translesion error-prone DNA polymerase V autoproteolytic subunit [Pustulibacterium marinum]SFU53037.1 DNA polymerase V [Pustulibacterium marinum]
MNTKKPAIEFFTPDEESAILINYYIDGVQAGFPTPIGDVQDNTMSLDRTVVRNKEATFYARVVGQSMINAGLNEGDMLVVDKSISPQHNQIAVCAIDGEFTVKRLYMGKDGLYLMPENDKYLPIKVEEFNDFRIWGIVTYVVKKM